ncbi:winged helix-turn-helix domain-containing protein [Streptosporangiaceae bacterium NEAU-GS5]|nr:winged helix-turn-helix domain-containing protein [Streptosporangiaceae bacterium NEAU-GS5]
MNRQMVQIRLLGPVDVTVDGVSHPVPGLRRKSVLAVLALHPGEVVSAGRLVDAVWGDDPPPSVANSLHAHIAYLRRALRADGAIEARPPGYLLNLPPDAVDAGQAMRLIAATAKGGDHAGAAVRLTAALDLWRGPSLADVAEVAWLRDQGRRLDEARLEAHERLVEARLALGDHLPSVAELEDLAARHPFRERLHQLLILALYRSGRQADALAAYHRLRQTLADELGIDPSAELRDLEGAILRQDPRLDLSPRPPSAAAAPAWIKPAQLPQTLAAFSGRDDDLARLRRHLPHTVVLLSGTAGVGKTTLAIQWAHQVKGRFPDGQLHVNLRGFDPGGEVMDPAEALHDFLLALGVPRDQIPASAHARAALYRSALAGKRVLIVADNARDERHVRPLLPGTPGCLIIVTSRNQLPGLVAADGAYPLALDRPSASQARRILVRRLGPERVDAEPEAVSDIITRCARLPLALAVTAARAALAPALPLAGLAAQLREAASTLDCFDGDDPATSVRAVFSWSYQAVSDPAARLFRLLGTCPGPDIALPAAAGLAALPTGEAGRLLAELTRAHLLTETSPGRFGFHDLLRAYAIEQTDRHDSDEQRAAARRRLLDHYVHSAHAAALLLKPGRSRIALAAPAHGVTPHLPADQPEALAWFAADRGVLLAIMARRPDGHDRHTWQLASALVTLLSTRGDLRDNEAAQQAGLRAARRAGDRAAQAHAHRHLALVHTHLGMPAEAQRHSQAALRLLERLDDPVATSDVHLNLGTIAESRGDIREAMTHTMRAYRSYRSLGHVVGQAYAANNIGWYHGLLGDPRQGLVYCQEALDILIGTDDLQATAIAWDSLGDLHVATDDPARGEHGCRQAIALYGRLGDRYSEAAIRVKLGDRRHEAGDPEAARREWRQALAVLGDLAPDLAARIQTRLDTAHVDDLAALSSLAAVVEGGS